MLGVFITLIYTYTMPNNHYCGKPTSLRCHLMAKCYLRVGKKSRSETRNRPTWGCKSMAEGLTIMLGVFITLLYTQIMPINYYSCKPTSLRSHLMAKRCLKVGRNRKSEARNLPPWGCKSMVEGLTIMLGVFINLLCTHTMPNNHYCSTYMMAYPHLMAKRWLRVGRNDNDSAILIIPTRLWTPVYCMYVEVRC